MALLFTPLVGGTGGSAYRGSRHFAPNDGTDTTILPYEQPGVAMAGADGREAGDTLSSTGGTVVWGPLTATLAVTEGADTLAGADPYRSTVKLLLHADEGVGNAIVVDSAPVPNVLTPGAGASESSTRLVSGAASYRFTSGGISTATAVAETVYYSVTNFTLECWVNFDSTAASFQFLYRNSNCSLGQAPYWYLGVDGTSHFTLTWWDEAGATGTITSTATFAADTWVHVAAGRSGTRLSLWINGVEDGFNTVNSGVADTQFLGTFFVGGTNLYIDEVRYSERARYTSTFTPETRLSGYNIQMESLATATLSVTEGADTIQAGDPYFNYTTVLAHNEFVSSTNIPVVSGTAVDYGIYGGSFSESSPFFFFDTTHAIGAGKALYNNGAGSGPSLRYTRPAIFTPGPVVNDFTLEGWIYPDGLNSGSGSHFGVTAYVSTLFVSCETKVHWSAGDIYATHMPVDGSALVSLSTSSAAYTENMWHHVAVTRNGTTLTLWVDGANCGTATVATGANQRYADVTVGKLNDASVQAAAWVDEVRYSEGVARYTSSFTPVQIPFPDFKTQGAITGTGVTGVVGSLAATEAGDTLTSSAVVFNIITGTLATTDAAETLSSSAAITTGLTGSMATADLPDTLTSTGGTVAVGVTASIADNADFILPADPYFSQVRLLMHAEGTNGGTTFVDSSSYAVALTTINSGTTSTTQQRSGLSSLRIVTSTSSGAGTTLTTSVPTASGDFTAEAWVYIDSYTAAVDNPIVWKGRASPGSPMANALWCLGIASTGQWIATFTLVGGFWAVGQVTSVVTGRWTHLALTRLGDLHTLWVDGVASDSVTRTGAYDSTIIERTQSFGSGVIGYVDEFRVTNGTARYTTTFTPAIEFLGAAFNAGVALVATLSTTDAAETLTCAVTVATVPITATLAATEAADTGSSATSVIIGVTSTTTDANETGASVSTITVGVTTAITEANDTLVMTPPMTVLVVGTGAATEGSDTLTSSASIGTVTVIGTLNVTEASDTLTSAGTVLSPLTVTLNVTEGADIGASTTTVAISATGAATEGADTLSAATTGGLIGTGAATEANDTGASVGTVTIGVTLAVTEAADTGASVSVIPVGVTLGVTEGADTRTSSATSGNAPITATLAFTEASDTLVSSGTVANVVGATLAATDAPETGASQTSVIIGTTLAATEAGDTGAALATAIVRVINAAVDQADTVITQVDILLRALMAAAEGGDTLTSYVDPFANSPRDPKREFFVSAEVRSTVISPADRHTYVAAESRGYIVTVSARHLEPTA
jgi:hypothetical protein